MQRKFFEANDACYRIVFPFHIHIRNEKKIEEMSSYSPSYQDNIRCKDATSATTMSNRENKRLAFDDAFVPKSRSEVDSFEHPLKTVSVWMWSINKNVFDQKKC